MLARLLVHVCGKDSGKGKRDPEKQLSSLSCPSPCVKIPGLSKAGRDTPEVEQPRSCPRACAQMLISPSHSIDSYREVALRSFQLTPCRLEASGWDGTKAEEPEKKGALILILPTQKTRPSQLSGKCAIYLTVTTGL